MEIGFLWVCVKIVLAESFQDLADVDAVFFQAVRKDEDVVQIDNHENVDHILEYVVHKILKRCRGVRETERHNQVLKGAVAGTECSFPLIAWLDADVVVACAEVDFGEYFSVP